MDTLALLCNLLAEGPATLRTLHREGVRTLSDVETQRIDHLASLLGATPAGARRFVGEARMLAARMDSAPLEREQSAPLLSAEGPEEAPRFASGVYRNPISSAPTSSASTTSLRPGTVEGLDADLCDRLAREGIRSLEALADASGLDLARRLGIRLTRLMDLAFLARCRVTGPDPSAQPRARRDRHSPRQETHPRTPLIAGWIERDADVSGPFV